MDRQSQKDYLLTTEPLRMVPLLSLQLQLLLPVTQSSAGLWEVESGTGDLELCRTSVHLWRTLRDAQMCGTVPSQAPLPPSVQLRSGSFFVLNMKSAAAT
ncbi:hypothetical protein EYF80_039196 [Liparis tanakae]|uniref:Uncharacterized protein n=1 Tax=Liparis tanakae TaxID=230148 RepID=A0A4Z2GD85_9TELE|nr:hypothetical protein EYF80_039196 [Liparis tanakae]